MQSLETLHSVINSTAKRVVHREAVKTARKMQNHK